MADFLRRLVNIGSFSVLQDKLDRWLDTYHINSSDQNVARCCEVIELNGKVQSQLFKLLGITASEAGLYGGASVIKSRLMPWLGSSFFTTGSTADATLAVLAESAEKDREVRELQDVYEDSMRSLEDELRVTKIENEDLRNELEDAKADLDASRRASTSDKMWTEAEISDLRAKLAASEAEVLSLRARTGLVDEYERQLRVLREDVAILTGRREALIRVSSPTKHTSLLSDSGSSFNGDLSDSGRSHRYLPRSTSPLSVGDVTQRVRQENLIQRFNDMFTHDRIDAMDTLRRYSADHENIQRICFSIMQEAFTTAKLSFREHKMRVRANLAVTHTGPETLEEAVQDYINRNTDLYDLPTLIGDVIHSLNRNPRLYLPPEVTYGVVQSFIREACKLAWNMSALAHPLDIALAADAELFDDFKYRRSYDSEFSAPLVNHHVWPCLMQGVKIVVKGEAVTRRGASITAHRSRSSSPVRSLSPSRARSRSPSPRRAGSAYDGRASPSDASRAQTTSSHASSRTGSRASRPYSSGSRRSDY